ncbi:MAG TPA: alpha/beta fold hydrolase [Gemmatimonadaceae bacterium]|nr:alpha/beta fold hydrolase [Gemmatimonadaceae bacterium]
MLLPLAGACQSKQGGGAPVRAPVAVERPCWFGAPSGVRARCHTVVVPERRRRLWSGGDSVRLAVAVFSRPGAGDRPALVFLQGGPGGAAIAEVVDRFTQVFAPLTETRDFVVLDQRGTGRSEPSLDCPTPDLPACRAHLRGQGIDLDAYTTVENAADVNDVRRALGYARVDLLGGSYGTLLAQAVMRDHPEAVRSAILDSPAPLQHVVHLELLRRFDAALQTLFDACRADAACDRRYPDLRRVFLQLVERLDAAPLRVAVAGSEPSVVDVSGAYFGMLVWQSLYYTEAIPHLPALIDETARGGTALLARIIGAERIPDRRSEGMQQSIECAEMAPFSSPAELRAEARRVPRELRRAALAQFGDVFERCAVWRVQAADRRAKEPLRTDTPVLLVVGAFDPATPPDMARETARTLSRHRLVVFPESGHGVVRTSDCARRLMIAFLDDPLAPPDVPCLAEMAMPRFVIRPH